MIIVFIVIPGYHLNALIFKYIVAFDVHCLML
jgi:hypothetical protein